MKIHLNCSTKFLFACPTYGYSTIHKHIKKFQDILIGLIYFYFFILQHITFSNIMQKISKKDKF